MGTANITFGHFGSGLRGRDAIQVFRPEVSEALSTGLTSTQSVGAAGAGSNDGGREAVARIVLDETGWIWVGANPTANKTTSGMKVEANTPFFVPLLPGEKVAILDDA